MMRRQRHRFLIAGSAAVIVLMLAACGGHTTAGFPVQAQKTAATHAPEGAPAHPPPPPKPLPTNSIKKLILSPEDVNELVGLPLDKRSEFASPGIAGGDYNNPDCGVAMGITKDALGNGEFTVYRGVQDEATKDDGSVGMFTQNIAIFETADKASELFHNAYESLGHCNSATITSKTSPTVWKILAPGAFNGDVVTFGTLQLTDKNQPLGWRCDHQARVKNNVIVEAWLCAWANGASAAAAAVDQIDARIPPPDKPTPPQPADFLPPNKIKSLIVGVSEAGKILGTNLGDSNITLFPPDPRDLGAKSNCSPLLGPDADTFGINVDYTAFREADYREDKDDYQHIVNQRVATYTDTQTASRTFQDAFKSLGGCDGALVDAGVADEQFQLQAPVVNGNTAHWAIIEFTKGQPDTWRCVFDLRTQSNVLFVAKVCQYGNAAEIVGQIADKMAASIPK